MGVEDAPATPSRHRWLSLAAICTSAGIVWLAFSDLAVAIPTIADELDADLDALQWANNAFSLVTGALVIAAGKFGDVFGRRRMLELGIVLLAGFSVVASLAPDVGVLIAGRALMGVGAALILPATLALIPPQFSTAEQITAFGVWQAVAWGGQAVGPAIGGILTEAVGWRSLFWVNLVLAAVAFAVVRAVTPESRDPSASRRIDWLGLVTIAGAVFCLLFALTEGPDLGWHDPLVLGLFVAAALLAVAWCLIELHVREPLVDFRLFRLRPYDGALVANTTMNLTFAGISFLLVLWLEKVQGYGPTQAGLLLLPATLGIFAFIPVGGRLSLRTGSKLPVVTGLVIMSTGVFLLAFLGRDRSTWVVGVALVVLGLGLGLLSTPISDTAVGGVPIDLAGTAAGVFKMSSMVGGAIGVALLTALATVFSSDQAVRAATAAGATPEQIDEASSALVGSSNYEQALSGLTDAQRAEVVDTAKSVFSEGVADSFVATGLIALGATALVFLLWPKGLRRRTAPGPG